MKLSGEKIAFIIGGIFGVSPISFILFGNNSPTSVFLLAMLPIVVGFALGVLMSKVILWPICKLATANICRGLGFNGEGPLIWIEYGSAILGIFIINGFVFLLIYLLYLKIKNKFFKPLDSHAA